MDGAEAFLKVVAAWGDKLRSLEVQLSIGGAGKMLIAADKWPTLTLIDSLRLVNQR